MPRGMTRRHMRVRGKNMGKRLQACVLLFPVNPTMTRPIVLSPSRVIAVLCLVLAVAHAAKKGHTAKKAHTAAKKAHAAKKHRPPPYASRPEIYDVAPPPKMTADPP